MSDSAYGHTVLPAPARHSRRPPGRPGTVTADAGPPARPVSVMIGHHRDRRTGGPRAGGSGPRPCRAAPSSDLAIMAEELSPIGYIVTVLLVY
eukprot:761513-Hanusia_phi.AAC.2